eukprot:gene34993-45292_t
MNNFSAVFFLFFQRLLGSRQKRKLIPPTNFHLDEDESNSNTATTGICNDKLESYLIELKNEGCSHAEAGDLRKALNIWQRAQQFIIDNGHNFVTTVEAAADNDVTTPTMRCMLHELKAQAYMELDMLMDAIREASSAVESCSRWPEGLLTLGRCQREIGEIELSIVTYESLMVEVKSLAEELKKRRQLQLQQLEDMPSTATPAEREVCMCKFNLAARAKPNSLT